ncbi:integrin alpha [Rhodobacter capsulatus]|uniref:integrin alpha n=1 Tax=Rhodobacter capsulatus TaxID=1061 RepID=UPI0040297AFD
MTRDVDLSALRSDQGIVLHDDVAGGGFGCCVASAGDINGDGRDDLMIGASSDGAVWVIFGQATSAFPNRVDPATLSPDLGFVIQGAADGSCLGASLAAAGDVNGDGFGDILIGAPRSDSGAVDSGAAWVIYDRDIAGGATPFDTIDLTALAPEAAAGARVLVARLSTDLDLTAAEFIVF